MRASTIAVFAAGAGLIVASALFAKPSTRGSNDSKGDLAVEFRGCPRIVNVEKPGGCLVLKSGKETYDIDSARPRPRTAYLMIAGTGIYDPDTVGICQTGKPLTHIKWHYLKTRCPIGGK
jgi:hypothetical protein